MLRQAFGATLQLGVEVLVAADLVRTRREPSGLGQYLVGAAGLLALLMVERVAEDGCVAVDLFPGPHDIAEGECSAVTRHGVNDSASIFSRLSSPEMSCCGMWTLATVTNGDNCSGHSTVTSSAGIRSISAHSWT